MQEMERPDGSVFKELFTELQVKDGAAQRRRELLEKQGMTFRKLEIVDRSKYLPHEGSKEVQRRVKQILRQAAAKLPA